MNLPFSSTFIHNSILFAGNEATILEKRNSKRRTAAKGRGENQSTFFFTASLKPAVTKSIPPVLGKRFCSLRHPHRAPAELCKGVEWIIFCHSHQTMSCDRLLCDCCCFRLSNPRRFGIFALRARSRDSGKFEFEFPRRPQIDDCKLIVYRASRL